MSREFRNGDLVRIPAEHVSPAYEGLSSKGLLGIVIDDIDADDEVLVMYPGTMHTGWWSVECLELISDGGGESYFERGGNWAPATCKTSPVVV